MADFRVVRTAIWDDPDKMEWSPEDRLFDFYLTTNAQTSICGVYAFNVKLAAARTGWAPDTVIGLLKRFDSQYGRIRYNAETKEVALKTWLSEHPIQNPNMKTGLLKEAREIKDKSLLLFVAGLSAYLPDDLKNSGSGSDELTRSEPVPNGLETRSEPVPNPLETRGGEERDSKERGENSYNSSVSSEKERDFDLQSGLPPFFQKITDEGKAHHRGFSLPPPARQAFIQFIEKRDFDDAYRVWLDFLKEKHQKLNIVGVLQGDLPKFLQKALENRPVQGSTFGIPGVAMTRKMERFRGESASQDVVERELAGMIRR